jgi:undecaprenyl phosphate N,N'-diacetylbacillosamine 1-phosphate transferase
MKKFYSLCKRGMDILISSSALIILSPIMFVIAIAIRLDSDGPVVFKQQRAGKGGRAFVFYKFRTMKEETEPFGPSPKSAQDQRLTKIGKFLREHSLDELPQFFNILKGDMSIVGPRPLYLSQIPEWNQRQKKRLLVKPGLTGLAQVRGRGKLTIEDKLEYDVRYVETASFRTDLKIIMATFAHLLRRKDVYEERYSKSQYTRVTK